MLQTDNNLLTAAVETIKARQLPQGGFSAIDNGIFRPDVTAWAAIAIHVSGIKDDTLIKAQQRLTDSQYADGRLTVSENQHSALWPTPLAILAWLNDPEFEQPRKKAINFLLTTYGTQSSNPPFIKHDGMLKGWSWNEQTHSWIIPTAITLMALRSCGYNKNERVQEGIKLLHDRQLPSGGWNYGNTVVFEQELKPIPECTGHALNALAGYAEYAQVAKSINYLNNQLASLKSPLSLSWAVLGLGAWGEKPENYKQLLLNCLTYQSRYGSYSTDLLSQILISYHAEQGLLSIFENMEQK
ncbi:MAG: prenyltransferase/squalene oxidase repeat-containing protein [Planctomycetota bacterium]|jgi:hypothetical protein